MTDDLLTPSGTLVAIEHRLDNILSALAAPSNALAAPSNALIALEHRLDRIQTNLTSLRVDLTTLIEDRLAARDKIFLQLMDERDHKYLGLIAQGNSATERIVNAHRELSSLQFSTVAESQVAYEKAVQTALSAAVTGVNQSTAVRQVLVDTQISTMERFINERFASSDKAILKAEEAAEKRFDGVNEFRAQLGDQQRTLIPK